MQVPLHVTYRHMAPSPALEAKLREKASKLGTFHANIVGCNVVIEQDRERHQQGSWFRVRVEIKIPKADIVVSRDHDEDVYIAVRDAFAAAVRQLQDQLREQRGQVKTHESAE